MSATEINLTENNLLMNVHQSNEVIYLTRTLAAEENPEGFVLKEEDYYKLCRELDPWTEEKIQEKILELEFLLDKLREAGSAKDVCIMYLLGLDSEALKNFKTRKELE